MPWQEIHTGGWVCSADGRYEFTGGPAPGSPCIEPGAVVLRLYVDGQLFELTKAQVDAQFGGPQSSYDPEFLAGIYQALWPDREISLTPPEGGGGTGDPDALDPCAQFYDPAQPGGGIAYILCQSSQDSGLPGGGGGGGAGRTYVKPDEGAIRENVKSLLVALTGRFDAARVEMLLNVYMQADRANFDNRGEQIDPFQAVRERIRTFDDYKRIHQLRPEEIDELEWVGQRQGHLIALGLSEQRAIDIGVEAAQAGLGEEDTATTGQIQEFQRTGQARFGLEDKLRQSARAGLRLLR